MSEKEVSQDVTNEDLEAAAAEMRGEQAEPTEDPAEEELDEEFEAEEESEEEELPDEPDDHRERSKLGRKVAVFEKELRAISNGLNTSMEEMRDMIAQLQPRKKPEAPEADPDDFLTRGQASDEYKKWRAQEKLQQQRYSNNLMQVFGRLGKQLDFDDHLAIVEDARSKHAVVTGNPRIDGEISFRAAEARFYKNKSGSKKNPFDKNKGKIVKNLGTSSQTTMKAKAPKQMKLGERSKRFLKYLRDKEGASEQEIQELIKE